MISRNDTYRELKLFLALTVAGVAAALFHVHIPHTDVLIDGRWAFGFMGFALFRRWWAALVLAALLSYPYGTPDIPLWVGFGGNMLYAVPSLLAIRPLSNWMLRRWGPGWLFGLGWGTLVLLCYQAFLTPVVWGVIAAMEGRPVGAGLIDGWRTQPYLVESVLVALFSAAAMVAVLAVQRLRAQRRRLEHINNVLLGIRNVNQLIVTEDDPERLIERACVNLTETMGYLNAGIALLGGEAGRTLGFLNKNAVAAAASAGFDGGFDTLRERLERGEFPACMKSALAAEETKVSGDPSADCPDCPLSGGCGGRAALARRLSFDGVTYGVLTVSIPADYARDAEEQDLFNEVADDLAFALHKIATARRQKQSEQRLSLVIEGSGLGTWEWNVQTNETVFNEQWAAMLGYTIEELTPCDYTTWERLVHPDDLPRARDALMDCVESRTLQYNCEFRMKHKDGHWLWILDCGRVMTRDDEGRALSMFGTHTDITEIKRAEEALRESEELFRNVFQKHAAVKLIIDPEDGRIVNANEAAASFYGWSLDELRGMKISEINVLSVEQVKAEMAKARENERIYFEFKHRLADGSVRDVAVYSSRVDIAGKELLHSIVHDITERKRAEEALQASETRYRCLFECAQDGILILDAETGEVVDVNPYLLQLLGHDRGALVGKPLWDIGPFHDIAASRDLFRVLQEKEYVRYEHLPLQRASGELVDVEFVSNVYLANDLRVIQCNIRDITERKRAEEALNREHEMLVRTEAAAHVGSWEWEAEGDKVTWSDELFRIYGLEPAKDAPSFAEHQALFVPEDRARLVQAVDECLNNGVPYDMEVRVTRSDGALRHCVVRGFPERDADGEVKRLYGSLQDITDIRVAEERIVILSHMLDEAPAAITIHDTEGRFVFANATTLYLHGYDSMDEFLKINLHELDVPESEALLAERFRKIAEEGEARFEVEHYRKDGSTFPLEILAKRIEWEGQPAVLSIATDITERKEAEEALKASEMRFKELLLNVTTVAVQGYALDGTVLYWNRASETLYGYTAEEALSQNLLDLIIPPDFREDTREAMRRMAETGETIPTSELVLMRKDRSLVPVYSSHAQVQLPGQKPELFCIDIDLTELKQAEAERERLQSQLNQSQKLESLGRLAGGVAHDFNNMLNVILGHADLALEDLAEGSPLREDFEVIRKAAERSANLTRQLLAFARRQTIDPKVLDLNETVASMLKMLERLIGEDIDLLWKPGPNLAPLRIDPGQVDQLLANLAINARDAIGHNTGKVTIETKSARFDEEYCADHAGFTPGDYVMLAVSDDGCGMDKDTLENIFEPFFTTKQLGQGTGLGLATVYGIVKQNEGFVNVYSEPQKGTTFCIYLPAMEAESPQRDEGRTVATPLVGGNETILVVEDEVAILNMTRSMLERLGYTVLAAATPSDAIRQAGEQAGKIDLVITDVVMPEMNGRELAEQASAFCPTAKTLYMSGYTANVIAHRGVLDEGVKFIQKPFTIRALAAKVRDILDT